MKPNDMVFFVFRGANPQFSDGYAPSAQTGGGPYRSEEEALRQARCCADVDGMPALVLGVSVMYLAQVDPPADGTPCEKCGRPMPDIDPAVVGVACSYCGHARIARTL